LRGAAASAVATLVGSIFAALFRVNALVLLGRVKVVRFHHALVTLSRVNVLALLGRVNIIGRLCV